jgi:hypothetical protein
MRIFFLVELSSFGWRARARARGVQKLANGEHEGEKVGNPN